MTKPVANRIYMTVLGQLLSQLNIQTTQLVRSIEKLQKKLINARNAVIFNETCIENGLFPKYTNLRLHDPAIQERQFTLHFRRSLVEEQLHDKNVEVTKLEQQQKKLQNDFAKQEIDHSVKHDIYRALHDGYKYFDSVVKERIAKKLNSLYGGYFYLKQFVFNIFSVLSLRISGC